MEISIKDIDETKKEIKAKIVFEEFKKFIEQVSNLPDQILKIKKNDKSRHMIDSSSE